MDKAYYLSVPDCNDWLRINLQAKDYNEKNFEIRKYAKVDNIDGVNGLVDKIVAIRKIFSHPWYELADGDDFYRIYVPTADNLSEVNVIRSSVHKEKLIDQKKYTNNYFKYETEAEVVAARIRRILGISKR